MPRERVEALATASNGFGFKLLRQLLGQPAQKNVLILPHSIWALLQIIRSGAAGRTKSEMDELLGTGGMEAADLDKACKDLRQLVIGNRNVVIEMASAIWYRTGVDLKPEFASANRDFHGATLRTVDFADPAAFTVLNAWAEQNTHGRIKAIVGGPLRATTDLILTSAAHFNGSWLDPFDSSQTRLGDFFALNGDRRSVQMMRRTGKLLYQRGDGFQAVRLPYAGSRLYSCIVLPDPGLTLDVLLEGLDDQRWRAAILPRFGEGRGTVVVPRFRLAYDGEIGGALKVLGMRLPFVNPDFSGMSTTPLLLNEVKHKTVVEVSEQGTQAAGVTSAFFGLAGLYGLPEPFELVVNRPFLFLIEDTQTGLILSVGAVVDPEEASAISGS